MRYRLVIGVVEVEIEIVVAVLERLQARRLRAFAVRVARNLLRRHRLLEVFAVQVPGTGGHDGRGVDVLAAPATLGLIHDAA